MTSGEPPPTRRDDTQPLPEVDLRRQPARSTAARAAAAAVGVLLLVLVGLLVANELVANRAVAAAEERVEEALGTPAEVRLRGWPVGLRLLTGRIPEARIRARDVPLDGHAAVVRELEVELAGIEVPPGGFAAPDAVIRAEQASFVAELGPEAVEQLMGLVGRIPLTEIELHAGVARLSFAGFPLVDATAQVEDGRVVFRPTAPLGALVQVGLELEELPLGFRVDDVELRRDALQLTGSARDLRIGG